MSGQLGRDTGEIVEHPRRTTMVVIFESRITDRTPAFHRWGPHQFEKVDLGGGEEIRSSTFATACGLVMDHTRWVERYDAGGLDPVVLDEGGKRWIGMRFDNADAIGSPCGKCWRGVLFGPDSGSNGEQP